MGDVKIIEVKASILQENDSRADALRKELQERGTFLLNLMGSPGSGKTTLLAKTIEMLGQDTRMGIMEADIDSDVDAKKLADAGAPSIQLHTGGMCHLDAEMTRQGLESFFAQAEKEAPFDLVVLENVGNLVCPAEFDTGSSANAAILSVPEGDDKPLKYPLMFEVCDAVVVSKMDVLPYFDFDLERFEQAARMRNPKLQIIPVCARTGEGMEEWIRWLKTGIARWKQ